MADEAPSYQSKPLNVPEAIGSLGLMAKEELRAQSISSDNSGASQIPVPGENTAPLGAFPPGPQGESPEGRLGAILVHDGDNWRAVYAPSGDGPFVLMHPGRGQTPFWSQTEECA